MKQAHLPIDYTPCVAKHMQAPSAEQRGAVYTRREVVDFILDLVEYTPTNPLQQFRLLEPACGEGDFLVPVVERLMEEVAGNGGPGSGARDLAPAVRAFEICKQSLEITHGKLKDVLVRCGVSTLDAQSLLQTWLRQEDFLLADMPHRFTHVVGNPPYVRQEQVPDYLLALYRKRYATIYDRADLYIPFIERSLLSLENGGVLGFICADRWMKNKYGGPLRALVAEQFHLTAYVDMTDSPAFHSEVIAYPAVTVIKRGKTGPTRIAHRPSIDSAALTFLARDMTAEQLPAKSMVSESSGITRGREPWILSSLDRLALVRRLEQEFPLLEEAGCKVGIGVATGADKIYIGPLDELDVEPERKLPLVKTKDIETGEVRWQGLGVINPFRDDGRLVDLAGYPRLASYFTKYEDLIRKRNTARKNPAGWYRTIDRIYPELTRRAKLLIPDIKGEAHIVYEKGQYYPHHNLYYIISDAWDLKALQALLQCGIAKLFVATYSTQMRGGFLRFQAQYLRRIRIPRWEDVPENIRHLLSAPGPDKAFEKRQAVYDLYRLSPEERAVLETIDTREHAHGS
ncbi:MAG: Eco57I restriction-modification methylase domain-containing protein [Desulfohalobiaceae bacterium]